MFVCTVTMDTVYALITINNFFRMHCYNWKLYFHMLFFWQLLYTIVIYTSLIFELIIFVWATVIDSCCMHCCNQQVAIKNWQIFLQHCSGNTTCYVRITDGHTNIVTFWADIVAKTTSKSFTVSFDRHDLMLKLTSWQAVFAEDFFS